jgi:hypothetical protein
VFEKPEGIRPVQPRIVVVLVDVVMQSFDAVQPVIHGHGAPVAGAVGKLDQVVVVGELVHVGPGKADVDLAEQLFPFLLDLRSGGTQEVVGLLRVGRPVGCVN